MERGEEVKRGGRRKFPFPWMARKLTSDNNKNALPLVSDTVLRALYTLSYLFLSHFCEVSAIFIPSFFR